MDFVLDSVSMNHITKPRNDNGPDDITLRVRERLVRIVVDRDQSLIDEWKRSANEEAVKALITHWLDVGGLVPTKKRPSLPHELRKGLAKLGFQDAGDRLVVSIALMSTDRCIISSDSDFFDPSNKGSVGDQNSCVARFLRESEEITVHTIKDIVRKIPVRQAKKGGGAAK